MKRGWSVGIVGLIIIIGCFIFIRCEKETTLDTESIDCEDCLNEMPATDALIVNFSVGGFDSIVIEVYEGYYDSGNLAYSGSHNLSPAYIYDFPVNNRYTVAVKYFKDGKADAFIDSEYLKVEFIKNKCDYDCYYVYGGVYDLYNYR